MRDDLKENVMDTNIWLRLVFMLVFAVVFAATRVVLVVVIAAQFLWVLFTAKRNDKLLSFGSQLATFIYQIYRYLSFNTEKRPFPFDDFPSATALIDDSVAEVSEAEPVIKEKAAEAKQKAAEKIEPAITETEEAVDDAVDATSETGVEAEEEKKG
ncbi:MAG: hypothetical protein AUJ57_07010 [Zetaproteobacteria bacterium CG1_02_53_45]|nr:MAG: hypothetical protein AUJ57_07010 [Zetaproteobacteria bacterium CG1_02_53_45]